jgi:integrase
LSQLSTKELIEYRASWQYAPLTALKKFERLRSFFRFCHGASWMRDNPMAAMKPPKADTPPTLPFTSDEVDRVIEAAQNYTISGSYGLANPIRVVAYIYLLRYSGLRISDATMLRKDRVTADGRLLLHERITERRILRLRIVRLDGLEKVPPRNDPVHLRQKLLAPRPLPLVATPGPRMSVVRHFRLRQSALRASIGQNYVFQASRGRTCSELP